MKKDKVIIVMPAYNAASTLEKTINESKSGLCCDYKYCLSKISFIERYLTEDEKI